MIEIKRILFPIQNDKHLNANLLRRMHTKALKLGTHIDSLANIHQPSHANPTKLRRAKRHRDQVKLPGLSVLQNERDGDKVEKENSNGLSQTKLFPSRCVRVVTDSLGLLGRLNNPPPKVSPLPTRSESLHKNKRKMKVTKRARGGRIRKSTRAYLKGLTGNMGSMSSTVSKSVISRDNLGEKSNCGRKRSRCPNTTTTQGNGLGAMFGILMPLNKDLDKSSAKNHWQTSHVNPAKKNHVVSPNVDMLADEVHHLENVMTERADDLSLQTRHKPYHNEATNSADSKVIDSNHEQIEAGPLAVGHEASKGTAKRAECHDSKSTQIEKCKTIRVKTRRSKCQHQVLVETGATEAMPIISKRRQSFAVKVADPVQVTTGASPSEMVDLSKINKAKSINIIGERPLRRSKRRCSTENTHEHFPSCSPKSILVGETTIIKSTIHNDQSKQTTTKVVANMESSSCAPKRDVVTVSSVKDISCEIPTARDESRIPEEKFVRRSKRQTMPPDRLGLFVSEGRKVCISVNGHSKRNFNVDVKKQKESNVSVEQSCDGSPNTESEHTDSYGWTKAELDLLRKSHQSANPTSIAFWDEVAEKVGSKTATECGERWFAFVKTPVPHPKKVRGQPLVKVNPLNNDDDVFNATPMRSFFQSAEMFGSTFDLGETGEFGRMGMGSAIKLSNDNTNGILTPHTRFKHGYKSYIKNVKRDVTKSSKYKVPKGIMKPRTSKKICFFKDTEGSYEVKGRLSPGGTLRLDTESSESDEFLLSDDEDI